MSRVRYAALFLFTTACAYAQTTGAATIVGTVTDNTGAVIAGAKITVVSPSMGFNFEGVTNSEGYYLVPYLRPGAYNLTVESQGFKKYVRSGIELRTNEQPRIDVVLDVGSVADSVEVQASAPLLETEPPAGSLIVVGATNPNAGELTRDGGCCHVVGSIKSATGEPTVIVVEQNPPR